MFLLFLRYLVQIFCLHGLLFEKLYCLYVVSIPRERFAFLANEVKKEYPDEILVSVAYLLCCFGASVLF